MAQSSASQPRGLLKATTLSCASSIPSRSCSSRSATRWLRRPIASAARWIRSRTSAGKKITNAISTPMPATIVRLPRNRSYSERPEHVAPLAQRAAGAEDTSASGPAMAKKRIVATKLMKVEVTATGSGTP